MINLKIFQTFVLLCAVNKVTSIYNKPTEKPVYKNNFCKQNLDIESNYDQKLKDGYTVVIRKQLTAATEIKVRVDSQCVVKLNKEQARFISEIDVIRNVFSFVLTNDTNNLEFVVKGREPPYHPPYVLSIKINGEENCRDPDRIYFEKRNIGVTKFWSSGPDKLCGRRKMYKPLIELIVSGSPAKSGNWPWHAAILRLKGGEQKYICGGTLISKFVVLTAAHCSTSQGVAVNPATLTVQLGKHTLYGTQITNQPREVYQVIVHENFRHKSLNNDIALLKLSAEAEYNNYVQPACIWVDDIYDQLPSYDVTGTVIGWGIDQTEELSSNLREATVPLVPDSTCIRYEPVFYSNMLNGKKFCAGFSNGTSACNGDSGGGLHVFVEDKKGSPGNIGEKPGAWYVKGIVSVTLALVKENSDVCDPFAYTVFTDVAKYRDWILNNMN